MKNQKALKYWTNMNDCASYVLEDRNDYKQCDTYDNADLIWISTEKFNKFYTDSFNRLSKQTVYMNHIPNFFEITRKDLLALNINKLTTFYNAQKNKLNKQYNITFQPQTYILPTDKDYLLRNQYFKPQQLVIVKPCGLQQGRGIFITQFKNISHWIDNDYQRILEKAKDEDMGSMTFKQIYLVQKYEDQPLLINYRKFDFRIYVLLTNNAIYVHRNSFVRLCLKKYDNEDTENQQSHLTNAAINHQKLPKKTVFTQLLHLFSKKEVQQISENIIWCIVLSILSGLHVLNYKSQCFELLGFDILLTKQKEVRLMEINSTPSMSPDGEGDIQLKKKLITDVLAIVMNYDLNQTQFLEVFRFQKQKDYKQMGEKYFTEYVEKQIQNYNKWRNWGFW